MNVNPAQSKFVPGTSRRPRRAVTLLAQMADVERGERIKALREQLHITQPVIADRVGVTLRAYQEWEAGGGIQWENAKRLGKVLGATPDYLMSGDPLPTPDLTATLSGDVGRKLSDLEEQVRLLRAELLARDAEVLKRIAELRLPIQDSQAQPPQ